MNMNRRTRRVKLGVSLFVLFATITAAGFVLHRVRQHARPEVGEKIAIRLCYRPAGVARSASDRRERLVMLCVESRHDKATFQVFYVRGRRLGRPRYTVRVNYRAGKPFDATTVVDDCGRRISRGGLVHGVPVPFTDLLGVSRSAYPASGRDGNSILYLDRSAAGPAWRLKLTYMTSKSPGTAGSFTENQYWLRRGSWMWVMAYRNYDGPSDSYDYLAERISPIGR